MSAKSSVGRWGVLLLATVLLASCGEDLPSEEESLARARGQLMLGKPRGALLELRNALEVNPRNPETRMLLGQTQLALFQGIEAESEFRRAYDLGLRSAPVIVGLAESILAQRRYEEVLNILGEASPRTLTEQAAMLALKGEAYEGMGEPERAEALYKEALGLSGASIQARLGLARLAMKDGRLAEARPLIDTALKVDDRSVIGWGLLGDLERSKGNTEAAKQAYEKAVERSSIPNVLQLKLAQVKAELGDYVGARHDLDAVREVAPKSPLVFITEGLLEYRLGNLTKAQSALETGLSGDPDNRQAAYSLGVLHYARGNWTEAAKYLERAGGQQRENEGFSLMLAAAKFNAGDVAGAAKVLDKDLDIATAGPKALALVARVRLAQGELEEGRQLADRATAIDPTLADLYVDQGLRLLQKGETDKALIELEEALARQPDSVRAQTAVFTARVKSGDREGALKLAQQMREERPDDAGPLVLLALLKALEQDIAGSESLLREALAMDPNHVEAASNLATLAARAGRFDEAQALYARILENNPDNTAIKLKSAILELKVGKTNEFERHLSALVEEHPEQLQARLLLARHYLHTRQAFRSLSLLKQLDPSQQTRPEVLAVIAAAQMALGEVENAVRSAESWVKASPDNPAARYLLAKGYAATKNRDGLERELFAAVDLDPSNPLVGPLINRLIAMAPSLEAAKALLDQLRERAPTLAYFFALDAEKALREGHEEEAFRLYRDAMERYPGDRQWPIALYRLYRARGELIEAQRLLESWLDRRPGDAAVRFYLGNLYLARGETERAVDAFSQVIETNPNNVSALNNLGWLLLDSAPRSALYHAERAAELGGRSAATLDTLGTALLANGQVDRAVDVLSEASGKLPGSMEIRLHLAKAWYRQGQSGRAEEALKSMLAEKGDFPGRADAQRLLREIGGGD
jgi:putative PEP-CTERM system TPR-repeat lipoprotein